MIISEKAILKELQAIIDIVKEAREEGDNFAENFYWDKWQAIKPFVERLTGKAVTVTRWTVKFTEL